MQKRWQIRKVEKSCLKQLCCDLSLPVSIARILMNRGIITPLAAERFLDPGLSLLKTLDRLPYLSDAVQLLDKAIRAGKRILVFGDYDADGLTACAILTLFLRKFSESVEPYIPNRFQEGYGLSLQAMPSIIEKNPHLVLTVDCGIKDFEGVSSLKKQGIGVIITDHHLPEPGRWPEADVVLATCDRETGHLISPLSGAGVALALAQAYADLRKVDREPIDEYLGMACIGTVGDVVPLLEENRVIVKYGLRNINSNPLPGIQAILELAGLCSRKISASEIGYILAPRLNAAGRMNDSAPALKLLLSQT
ncbi:MAG TPA: DHH family phosphoesterase, partial [Atribacteraceae bacterium]|nr:DHH family phosphoesterase [Atribacteraceae bacterium]